MNHFQDIGRQTISLRSIFRRLFHSGRNVSRDVSPASRFARFGEGASGVIHDLSNPLTVISLSLEHLQNNARIKSSEAKKHIEAAARAARNMKLFLSAAKKQLCRTETDENFDIAKGIRAVVKFFRSIAKKSKVKIRCRSPRAVFIRGDQLKFFRVISNLVSNAMDSYVSFPPERNRLIIIKTETTAKMAAVSVRDFGCGIPKHLQKGIFEPFYSTKQKKEGAAGLGLSIVKNIVENDFGGRIRVESAPGRGSVFKITLPLDKNRSPGSQ